MFVETARIITSWLQHGTYGINALLPTVPGGPVPPVALITDETQNERVALGKLPVPPPNGPTVFPCVVGVLRPFDQQPAQVNGPVMYGQVALLWQYGVDQVDTDVGTANAYRTLRALCKSVARLFGPAGDASARTLDEVQLTGLEGIRFLSLFSADEDGLLIGGVEVRVNARDQWLAP